MYTLHIPSMYDIFTCVWLIHMVHLGKYTLQALQGCYGFYTLYITYIKKNVDTPRCQSQQHKTSAYLPRHLFCCSLTTLDPPPRSEVETGGG